MAIKFNRSQTFATNGTVTAPSLHNLVDGLDIYQSLITDQTNVTSVSTADELLIAIAAGSEGDAPKAVTVQELFQDALSAGTYTNANISEALSYGTATGTRLVSANATITTGTITTGVIPSLTSSTATFGTTTSTAATITSGTITNLASTIGTIATLNSTTGTIATLNSTTGTITNLSTTLAGDFTISQGTATLATSGATAGTYGSVTAIPFLTVDAKGRITSATTGTFSSTPADGSITPAKLSQPFTSGNSVASTSGTAIDFTGIPSWVKRVTVMFSGVSTNGVSVVQVQLGSGSPTTSGYLASATGALNGASPLVTNPTTGFQIIADGSAGFVRSGILVCTLVGSNIWVASGNGNDSASARFWLCGGSVSLSGTLDRVRITTVNGTDTFDAGSVNIMYEG
jgi:hypothetical protein